VKLGYECSGKVAGENATYLLRWQAEVTRRVGSH